MADDFQPSNWWNKSKNCNVEHSDSKLQFSGFGFSASCSDWSQTPISSSSRSEIAEPGFHAMLQEDLSTADFFRQEVKEMNQPLLLAATAASSSSSSSSSYAIRTPISMMQSFVEPDTKFRRFLFDDQQMMSDYQYQMIMAYGRGSNEIHLREQSADINLMQFMTNNSTFLNDSPGFYDHSPASPIGTQFFETKPSFTSLIAKSSGGLQERKISSESVLKKPRIETSAPFKVRKEKLGDRITALQQLVSPFGKTDTASVLHEAIVHIKLLHDQVSVLSTPYLMNAHPMQQQKNSGKSKKREDLRSRGLCLVPIPITCPVTSEVRSDFWTPAFGRTHS